MFAVGVQVEGQGAAQERGRAMHKMNNQLAILLANLHMSLRHEELPPEVREMLLSAREAAQSVALLAQGLVMPPER